MVGDAFATSCPAAGTGARKVMVDVERLCNVHIPQWLATPEMRDSKIASFYADPIKQACDALSVRKAFKLRSSSIDPGLRWTAMRFAKFVYHFAKGLTRSSVAAPAPAADDDTAERAPTLAQGTAAQK
jgi:hypothetical protein